MKVIILDYSTGCVHVFSYDPKEWSDVEDYVNHLSSEGFIGKVGDCNWMSTDDLTIQIH